MSKRNKLVLPVIMAALMMILSACGDSLNKPKRSNLTIEDNFGMINGIVDGDSSNEYESKDYLEDNHNNDEINEEESVQKAQKSETGLVGEEYIPLVNDKLGNNIVYKANVYLSSKKYTEDKNKIVKLLNSKDIAIQYQEESTRNDYDEIRKKKTKLRTIKIIARPEKEKFDSTLQEVQGIGTLEHLNRGSEDITREVQDIDIRLKTVNSRIERLESHIKETKNMTEILKLENMLEQEIVNRDKILSEKEVVKDKINLTTIEITLDEKIPEYTKEEQLEFERIEKEKQLEEERLEEEAKRIQVEKDKFGYRFKQEFKNMLYKTKTEIENFILLLVGNLVSLILLAVIAYIIQK